MLEAQAALEIERGLLENMAEDGLECKLKFNKKKNGVHGTF